MESTEQPEEPVAVEEPARPRRSRRAPVEEPAPVEYVPPSYRVVTKFDTYEVGDLIPGSDPRVGNLINHGLIG